MKVMEIKYVLLADAANKSAEGKVNVLGLFDAIMASNFPFQHPQMALVFAVRSNPSEWGREVPVEIRLVDQDGRAVWQAGFNIQFSSETPVLEPTRTSAQRCMPTFTPPLSMC